MPCTVNIFIKVYNVTRNETRPETDNMSARKSAWGAVPTIKVKKCTNCNIEKLLNDFYNQNDGGKFGKKSACKKCTLKNAKKNRENNKEEINKKKKDYYEENKNRLLVEIKEYRQNNKEKISITRKKYYQKNKNKIKKEIINREKKKLKNDKIYKLKHNIKGLFYNTFKRQIIIKTKNIFSYTGILFNEYINHLKQSEYWKDYCDGKNKIEIDHIIPCSVYNFNDPEEIKKCWNPRNLRLLPSQKNRLKSNKIDFDLIKYHEIKHLLPKGQNHNDTN